MSEEAHILIWQDGPIGFIQLNRPKALNALSHQMALDMEKTLINWADDDNVSAVIIEGAGEKAFCAGGDIIHLYHSSRVAPEVGRQYWRDEYRLNELIASYPKPYIALMDAIVMGGGVGVSSHGSHRIVTERTMLAMPEVGIGFLPDVGGTYLLSRSPGKCGLYLGMSGARMGAADAIYAGFADAFMDNDTLADFKAVLVDGMPPDDAVKKFCSAPADGVLAKLQNCIDDGFGQDTALKCVERLKELSEAGDQWANKTLGAIRKSCPLSVMATFEAINAASDNKLEQCLAREYRFAYRAVTGTEFYEGVRAAVIDKDRSPKWQPAMLEDVTPEMVQEMFAPPGEDEWKAR